MVKHSKGFNSGNTKKLKRKKTLTLVDRTRKFNIGDTVFISPKPDYRGLPHLRYVNKCGEIIKQQGSCYCVKIMDGNKKKILVCGAMHLKTR
jgi:ribosomal protein L21E